MERAGIFNAEPGKLVDEIQNLSAVIFYHDGFCALSISFRSGGKYRTDGGGPTSLLREPDRLIPVAVMAVWFLPAMMIFAGRIM